MRVLRTIKSACNNAVVYANAGDEVSVIAEHGVVTIVENIDGQRFPVPANDLTEDKTAEIKVEPVIVHETIIAKPTRKSKAVQQTPQLF